MLVFQGLVFQKEGLHKAHGECRILQISTRTLPAKSINL